MAEPYPALDSPGGLSRRQPQQASPLRSRRLAGKGDGIQLFKQMTDLRDALPGNTCNDQKLPTTKYSSINIASSVNIAPPPAAAAGTVAAAYILSIYCGTILVIIQDLYRANKNSE